MACTVIKSHEVSRIILSVSGVHSSSIASAQIFDTKMQGLQTLLEKQEQIYRTEESALKVSVN